MKKRILKIVVGGLTTISLILSLCFIDVKASSVNNNFYSYILDDETYSFKPYTSITNLNDLKGTFWVLGFDGYEMFQTYYNQFFGFNVLYNTFSDVRRIPFILQPRNSYVVENIGYIHNSSAVLSFLSLNKTSSFFYSSFSAYPHLGLSLYNISYDNALIQIGNPFDTFCYVYDLSNEIQLVYDIAFENDITYISHYPGFPTFILCFPNSNEYTLNYVSYNTQLTENQFVELFKKYSTQVTPSSLDNIIGQNEYYKGYDVGYDVGYFAGQESSSSEYRYPLLAGVFNTVNDILSIEVFPNIKLSYFIFIPLVLGITGMIFWFWRKD